MLGAHEEPAYHRLDFGARELDADDRGHRLVRIPFRQPMNLRDERGAKISVLAAFHEVAGPRPGIHAGVAGAEVALDRTARARFERAGFGDRARLITFRDDCLCVDRQARSSRDGSLPCSR